MFIDTHTHLYTKQFDEDRTEMIDRAIKEGVEAFFMPNIDQSSIESMINLEQAYPKRCFAMMGLHPCSVNEDYETELEIVQKQLQQRSFVAIGEIGIDLYWEKMFLDQQIDAFQRQISWAKKADIPIVIHCRNATPEVLKILREYKDEKLRGIFHCFGGSVSDAEQIIELGFLLGIGGVLTFKKSGLDKTLENIGLEHLVLETDAPYLAPAPFRGKRNESSYLKFVAEKLAEVKEVPLAEIAKITTDNAMRIFRKDIKTA